MLLFWRQGDVPLKWVCLWCRYYLWKCCIPFNVSWASSPMQSVDSSSRHGWMLPARKQLKADGECVAVSESSAFSQKPNGRDLQISARYWRGSVKCDVSYDINSISTLPWSSHHATHWGTGGSRNRCLVRLRDTTGKISLGTMNSLFTLHRRERTHTNSQALHKLTTPPGVE